MLTCHVDEQWCVEKKLLLLCSLKVSTYDTKNIDRILKCLDRLRSNFHKLANLRLTTLAFWNPGFTALNLKIIFQNC